MRTSALIRVSGFMTVLLFTSLACFFGGPAPTPAPVQEPVQEPVQQEPVQPQEPVEDNSGGWQSFTDENDYFAIDVPAGWAYEHTVSEDGLEYWDTFSAPDEQALVESFVYDDKDGYAAQLKGAYALYLLNTYYSYTGKEGDIRVSSDQIMDDGSERLVWTSRGGGYSGMSFLESRGSEVFLFFTVEWVDSAEDEYLPILNDVIASYRIP